KDETGGVDRVSTACTHERPQRRAPEVLVDVGANCLTSRSPLRPRSRQTPPARDPERAVECDPAQHARVEKFLAAAPHFPDALVGTTPVAPHPIDQLDDPIP